MKPKTVTRVLLLLVWLSAAVIGFTMLNSAERYRERGFVAQRNSMSVKTVNGGALEYANLEALQEAEKGSRVIFTFVKVAGLIVVIGVGGGIVVPIFKKEEEGGTGTTT